MPTVTSKMIALNSKAPDFTLMDTKSGKMVSLKDIASLKATVIMFICNHCPFVRFIMDKLLEVAEEYTAKQIAFIAISSNSTEPHPEDGPEFMAQIARERNFPFPYLYDESQDVARNYNAACTPDFFVYDKDLKCVYRGRFDESTPNNGKTPTGAELSLALDCVLTGKPMPQEQKPSIGCNIKWKEADKKS